jgi:GT2 family glycosyltransferase
VTSTPSVDVLIVLYNCQGFIRALLESLGLISIPFTAYFLDNGSQDETAQRLTSEIPKLPFRAHFLRSLQNHGFAEGVNLLARQGSGEFIFILNPDAELQKECLEKLLYRAQSDPKIAVCEARQFPREHPKIYDVVTGETTWCSGAAALVRRDAFEQIRGFDERLFFMYCEDVDLSWRLWLKGWKCIYVPDAVVNHYTQDLTPAKRRTAENYFTFRNSLFLYYRFGEWDGRSICWGFLWKRIACSKYTWRSKILFMFAFVDHIRYIPYLLHTRQIWGNRKHPWIRLEETSLRR